MKCGPGNVGNGCLESLKRCLESWISFWSPSGVLDVPWNNAPKGPMEPLWEPALSAKGFIVQEGENVQGCSEGPSSSSSRL